MASERWEEVKDLFQLALKEAVENRLAFLLSACNNQSIRIEVQRLLQQHDEAGDFLSEPIWANMPNFSSQIVNASDFCGTPRFVVHERLGEGAFGVVYRVLDRERNSIVALKTLRRLDAAHLSRFKREFRSLIDLAHPNLVQLYELFGNDQLWFFTMELVVGTDFLSYTRPNDVLQSWDRLRNALIQLTSGVQALHSSARIHRDLKPNNVLVSNSGRIVILDFGLVKELEAESAEQSIALAGSPSYMAPEQVGGGKITTAVDWYAVGVMLYRGITGALPFQGDWHEVLTRKQAEDPPAPAVLIPDVPEDLNEICVALLQRAPELRADDVFILKRLRPQLPAPVFKARNHFAGRSQELEVLSQRFCVLESGIRQIVLLRGRSGIGKTALVDEFLNQVSYKNPETVILRGRCRESETVPYKALDSVADQVVSYLRTLTEARATALLPTHPALLVRMFPVFGELDVLATISDRLPYQGNEQLIRRLAFAAISEMLGRMAARHPVVITIDDLQWSDHDSIAFLTELIVPADAPPLMLVLAFRSEDAGNSPPLLSLSSLRNNVTSPGCWTEIDLAGLPEEDACKLLRLLDNSGKLAECELRQMAKESQGSPLFLSELLRMTLQDVSLNEQSDSVATVSIAEMIRRRAETLSPIAREVFDVLSVAVEPLSKTTLSRIVGAADAEFAREIRLLVQENLVRVKGGLETGKLEPFHDQVREASVTALSSESLRNWHQRLALAYEVEGTPDPQKMVRHYSGAGDMAATFRSAAAAAKIAQKALAFDRAAAFYTEAIKTGAADANDLAMLYSQRAEALANAGRGREAAADYLAATERSGQVDALRMRRLASEQLMRSGYFDEGLEAFTALLRSVGFWMPATPIQSIGAMLTIRAFIRLRGLRWKRRKEIELPSHVIRNLDLLWSGAAVFFHVNPVFGTYLQARHMIAALRAGEPYRLALSVGQAASFESLGGVPYYQRGRKLMEFAEHIASDLQNTNLSIAITINWVFLDFLSGRIRDGLEHSRKAIEMLRELGTERTWESSTARMGLIWFLGWGGRIREMSELVPDILDEARSRGDVFTFVMLRCTTLSHRVELAADDPHRAIKEIGNALGQWSQARYDTPHFLAAFSTVECELYVGRFEQARRRVLTEWSALLGSLLFRKCQSFRVLLYYMRARTALAIWLQQRDDRTLVREVEHYASRLRAIRSPWGVAIGEALQSSVEAGCGRVQEAILLLDSAEATLRQQDLRVLAEAVSRRRGELEGAGGTDRVQTADAFMRSEGILRPDRMAFMILPG